MTLEAILDDKSKIPEGLESHYKEIDGKFVLDVPGMKTQADFDNYAQALKARYADSAADFARGNRSGLSRDDVMKVIEDGFKKFAQPGDGQGKGNGSGSGGEGDGDVSARLHDLERNVASLTEANKKLEEERDAALGRSRDTTIRNALTEAATKAGAVPDGVANLVTLVSPNFETAQDGSVVTKLDAGEGVSPNQKPADYFAGLARNPAFRMFWGKSQGAGADGGDGGGGGGAGDLGKGNPWTKAGWNVTAQSKLFNTDRPEAERLMKAAGVKLGATAPVR